MGTFTYTRRKAAPTGLIYSIWTSTDLRNWSEDPAASQFVTAIPETDNESILVTPNPHLFHKKRLFFRIQAR